MYGLALLLTLAASHALWRWVTTSDGAAGAGQGQTRGLQWGPALAYLLAGLAALYTLYYVALLLCAQALWAIVRLRKNLRALAVVGGVYLLMFLLYLPWLTYAVPQLVGYVGGKVQSDQDAPLGPLAYLEHHLVAFTAGQVRLAAIPAEWMALAPATIAICAVILGLVLVQTLQQQTAARKSGADLPRTQRTRPAAAEGTAAAPAVAALWTWLVVPVVLGWLINLRLPFFPAGGERLLLITLPYLLLLLAYGIDRTWAVAHLGKLAAGAMAINATVGIAAFYTTPRYAADDYRPLIRQTVQQGSDDDTWLAIFPWQVGYWRAYTSPAVADPRNSPVTPTPLLLSDGAVAWSPQLQAEIAAALDGGAVWFPEPLTFGSSLPHEIEQYLAENAVNLENRWYDATRLTAWARLPVPPTEPINADYGSVRLAAAGIDPAAAESANAPVAATLGWELPPNADNGSGTPDGNGLDLNVSLRLQDDGGHVWYSREYGRTLPGGGEPLTETVGLIVPAGLPPGGYQVAVSVQTADGQPLTIAQSDAVAAVIGNLEVTQPDTAGSAPPLTGLRLPIQHSLARPSASGGLRLLGYSGPDEATPLLAGTELAATLFFENLSGDPQQSEIYLSLLDAQGAGVAGYEGWPLPGYPTVAWPNNSLAQVPVAFNLPGILSSGNYRLVAGFRDPATGEKTPPVELATIAIVQRPASFTRPTPTHPFADPPQLGTHAQLLGYDLTEVAGGQTSVRLYWEVIQPLLPPHHIFVHLDTANGETIAQQDGPPAAAGPATDPQAGPAPSGSWQPGEFLITEHLLDATPEAGEVVRVGLYDPQTQVRLPVTVNGQPAGDNVVLQ